MDRMPTIIHGEHGEGITLGEHTLPPSEWLATVRRHVGQCLNQGEAAYAEAMAEHYGWTARICADAIKRHREADAAANL